MYRSIDTDLVHGALDVAYARVAQARVEFSQATDAGVDWPMRFRLLQADIVTYQGGRKEVIALLTAPNIAYPVTGDAAIKRDLLLGLAHYRAGQTDLSKQELRSARALAQASNSILMGEMLRTEGVVHVYADEANLALESFKQSLALARARDDRFLEATDLLNIGFVTSHLGQYDAAVPLLSDAAEFAQAAKAQTVLQAALGNLGEVYLRLGDYEQAWRHYSRAEQLAEQTGASGSEVEWLQWLGLTKYKLGDLKEARTYYERALALAQALKNNSDIAEINADLAALLFRQKAYDAAAGFSEAAIRAAHEAANPASALGPRFIKAILAQRQARFEEAARELQDIHSAAAIDDADMRWEVENALANVYASSGQSVAARSWYRRSIETFESQRASVADEALKLSFFANGDSLYRDYADFLIAAGRSKEALQLLDRGRARTLEEGLAVTDQEPAAAGRDAVDAESVARKLDACILFYALGPDRSYLWAVTAGHTQLFSLPKQADIESLIQRYQKSLLRSTDPVREANADAVTLYQQLVAPAAAMIPDGSRVFLIGDGALSGLNFETLLAPSRSGLQYWIEKVTVASAGSIRLLAGRGTSSRTPASRILIMGDPTASGKEFERLANAGAEIGEIQKHFGGQGRTVLTDALAIPAAYFKAKPDQYAYIHFTAHGTANRLSPLDSAVVLSPPSDDPNSFKLYARDILKHPLNARLVTVSACYGSGLRNYAGEGLVGLAWAFLRAGSHDVIAALWEVDDVSTSILMDHLYAEIEQDKAPDAALRAAKLAAIHSNSVYRKPFYWGAFQLYTGA